MKEVEKGYDSKTSLYRINQQESVWDVYSVVLLQYIPTNLLENLTNTYILISRSILNNYYTLVINLSAAEFKI